MDKYQRTKTEEYRELWNILNTEANCLKARLNQVEILKDWIDRRLSEEDLPEKKFGL